MSAARKCRLPANVGKFPKYRSNISTSTLLPSGADCPQMSAARKCRLPASVPGCPQVSQLPANVSAARKCDPSNFARKVVARKKFARKLVARKVVARKRRDAKMSRAL
ncbi:unnamed protein product [Bursaphelenchus xylophilus]|uniref:(pine wood nematode) hypothetical protein n=1 Tax=Bursaphelenchus xylophilus TaxID=6326 RepID=A0A811M0A9_BURXY|nr:unnamed protein product [Bursaphelenchus xylophilus]CAG9124691.1 unnamed protein product [Bursaphelenchus xylophilus]